MRTQIQITLNRILRKKLSENNELMREIMKKRVELFPYYSQTLESKLSKLYIALNDLKISILETIIKTIA